MTAIKPTEIEWTAIRAQGAGGQNVNKVSSAVYLRFEIRASQRRAPTKADPADHGLATPPRRQQGQARTAQGRARQSRRMTQPVKPFTAQELAQLAERTLEHYRTRAENSADHSTGSVRP